MAYSPSAASTSPSGLQLLLAATMILTPKTRSTSTQSMITPVPYAPKKDRSAKSCAAVAPYISQLTFDVGGGDNIVAPLESSPQPQAQSTCVVRYREAAQLQQAQSRRVSIPLVAQQKSSAAEVYQ
eukprot:scaffold7147_cov89-Skeletonema_dohrnii-CCMP3373.AAC.4